jgi:hypothetical protein
MRRGVIVATLLAAGAAAAQQGGKRQEIRGTDPPWIMAGKTSTVRIMGNDLAPDAIAFGEPGLTGKIIKTESNADKRRGNLAVEVEVNASTELQPRPYRFNLTGPNVQPGQGSLLIDTPAPEIEEKEPNNDLRKPQLLPGPCTVNGKLDNEGVDVFRIDGKAGETWRFEVFAKRIKADNPLEAVMRLRDPRMAPVRAVVDQGDDCSIRYKLPLDGPYLLELFDGDNRSSGAQVYKLFVRRF